MQALPYESRSRRWQWFKRLPLWGRVLVVAGAWSAAAAVLYGVCMCLVFVGLLTFEATRPHRLTTSLQSPDGRFLAELREVPTWDRNFEIILRERGSVRRKKILDRSADEGRPGTERFVWSDDSKRLLLLGRAFVGVSQTIDSTGEQAYLLYDTADGSLRCNSHQMRISGFTEADLAGFTFAAPASGLTTSPATAPAGGGN